MLGVYLFVLWLLYTLVWRSIEGVRKSGFAFLWREPLVRTFAVGAGVGWVVSLPTDPTRSAAVTPATEPVPAVTERATATPVPGEQAAELTAAPPEPIDLDELPGAGPLDEDLGAGITPAPPPTPVGGTPPTATASEPTSPPSADPAASALRARR